MKRDHLQSLTPLQLAALGGLVIVTSSVVALTILVSVRSRLSPKVDEPYGAGPSSSSRFGMDRLAREEVPAQPAIDPAMPAELPQHFSEDLIVPGYTMTGTEITAEDAQTGRSPEGA